MLHHFAGYEVMLPVPQHVRQLLCTNYGISSKASMFIIPNQPQRVYLEHEGNLNFVDFPFSLLNADDYYASSDEADTDISIASVHRKSNNAARNKTVPSLNPSRWHSMSDAEREILQKEYRKANAYKTALCQAYKETGFCCYGPACRFAHGEHELRLPPQTHPKFKTQLCNKFALFGKCPYGPRCQFIHQRPSNLFFRRSFDKTSSGRGELSSEKANQPKHSMACGGNVDKNTLVSALESMSLTSLRKASGRSCFTSSYSGLKSGDGMSKWQDSCNVDDSKMDGLPNLVVKSEVHGSDSSSGTESDVAKTWYSNDFENWSSRPGVLAFE